MNQFKSKLAMTLVASAMAFSSASALAGDQAVSYGRAGGTVGADRIRQLTAVHAAPSAQAPDQSKWYGRAGGMVGSDRVQQLAAMKTAPAKVYAAGETKARRVVYGRAGVPLPFGD